MSFAYRCTITPLAAQVPSPQSNFAVFVSVTDNALKDIAHGGPCRADGFDIRAFSNSSLVSTLQFYREFYDGAAGTWRGFINVSALQVGVPYYLGVGNAALTTDASSASGAFSNAYLAVIPFENGSTLSVADALGNWTGTNNGATAASGPTGTGGAASFAANDVDYGAPAGFATPDFSIALSIKSASVGKAIFGRRAGCGNSTFWTLFIGSGGGETNTMVFSLQGAGANNITVHTTTMNDNAWHRIFAYRSGATAGISLDGGTFVTGSAGGVSDLNNGDDIFFGDGGNGSCLVGFTGLVQKIIVSNGTGSARSQDWATTDSNMFLDPTTFASYVFEPLSSGIGARFIRNSNGIWVFNTGGAAQGNLRGGF